MSPERVTLPVQVEGRAGPPLGQVSWERMIRAVEKVRHRLQRVVAALEGARVPYAVAGGNAVAAWGIARGRDGGAKYARCGHSPVPPGSGCRPRSDGPSRFHLSAHCQP